VITFSFHFIKGHGGNSNNAKRGFNLTRPSARHIDSKPQKQLSHHLPINPAVTVP